MRERKVYVPFRDPQRREPTTFCQDCGREVYGTDGECLYCQSNGV